MPELSPDQWAEIEELFARALEIPSESRPDFLRRECPVEDIRREVESLLDHAGSEALIVESAIAATAAAVTWQQNADERLIGTRLGSYRLDAIAGYGGMGAVYRAFRDDDEYRQRVAIKLVRAAADSRSAQQRFRQERQILARLSHPNIARLLDGGSTSENVPYLVMEFIEGEPITVWCERNPLDVKQRVQIFLPVCDGVDAANRQMVIHRDLKPANILVTSGGIPKLLDFGIAKLLSTDSADPTFTATRHQVMTPEYASPEQVRGEQVTAATDVYSLGLVLYEMLTGQKAQPIPENTPDTIVKVVCLAEPVTPARLKSHLSGDLDNIIRKAIRKEPERRYLTAADLRRDLDRYLGGRPVLARPDTFTYRTGKFLRRNRGAIRTGLITAACVASGLTLIYWSSKPPRPPRVLQVEQLTRTGRVEIGGHVVTDGSTLYFTERRGGRWTLARVPANGGTPTPLTVPLTNPNILDISPDLSHLLLTSEPSTNGESPVWIVAKTGESLRPLTGVVALTAGWSRDGHTIVFTHGNAIYRIDNDGTGLRKVADVPGQPYELREAPANRPHTLRFSLQGKDLRPSRLWEVQSDGAGLHPLSETKTEGSENVGGDFSGDWDPSGHYYLFHSWDGSLSRVLALREPRTFPFLFKNQPVQIYSSPHEIVWITTSADGRRILFAAGMERRELVGYVPARKQFMPFLPGVSGRHVEFSSDRRHVAYTTVPDDILWTNRPDGGDPLQLSTASVRAFRPKWSPDGKSIAYTGNQYGRPDQVYVVPSIGGAASVISGESGRDPSWSPEGKSILFARVPLDGLKVRRGLFVKDLTSGIVTPVPGSATFIYSSWSPDGRYVAATGEDAQLHLFDFRTQQWSELARGSQLGYPFWSHGGLYVYFQDVVKSEDAPIYRVRIANRNVERLMSSKQIPQSDVTGYALCGLAPDDAPIATVIRSNSDVYALDVDLP